MVRCEEIIYMEAEQMKKEEKSKIEADDGWNRTLYGSPTAGGFTVAGLLIIFIVHSILAN
jgi:hypothetical protein